MENYSIYLDKETEKYKMISIVREVGAILSDVSGCGTGYHISVQATPIQAETINRMFSGV